MSDKRFLVLAPHTDDGEFGCGGTIAKLIGEGWEAHYVAFSGCKESLPAGCPLDTLVREAQEATALLGIAPAHMRVLGYKVREFPGRRQDILEEMIRLRADIKPRLVYLPSVNDTHQDHQQIALEGFRAFKSNCMLGYEMPWNNLVFQTSAFTILEERHLRKKVEALYCYKTQAHRPYASEEFVYSLARTRGTQIGTRFAETFELTRWIM